MVVLERSMRWVGGKKARIARPILFLSLFYFSSAIWSAALDSIHKVSQYAHTAWRVQDVAEDFRGPFTQTADGYFWFGTASGLVRFDGVRFVPYAPSGLKLPSRGFKYLLVLTMAAYGSA
jgi:ligand-binding sensor domain-containing protein